MSGPDLALKQAVQRLRRRWRGRVLLDHQDVVAPGGQIRGQVPAHGPRPGDHHPHG